MAAVQEKILNFIKENFIAGRSDVAIANNGVTASRADGYSVRCIKD